MNFSKICECVKSPIREFLWEYDSSDSIIVTPNEMHCCVCRNYIGHRSAHQIASIVIGGYKCRRFRKTIHTFLFAFDSDDCYKIWIERTSIIYGFGLFPHGEFCVPRDAPLEPSVNFSPQANEFIQRFTEKNELSTTLCGRCKNFQLKCEPKFKICGGCKNISYCTRDCQKDHWSEHKPFCRIHQGIATQEEIDSRALDMKPIIKEAIKSMPQRIKEECMWEIASECECFEEKEKHLLKAMIQGNCSWMGCKKKVHHSFLEEEIVYCTKKKGKVHCFSSGFCSEKCRRKYLKDYTPNTAIALK